MLRISLFLENAVLICSSLSPPSLSPAVDSAVLLDVAFVLHSALLPSVSLVVDSALLLMYRLLCTLHYCGYIACCGQRSRATWRATCCGQCSKDSALKTVLYCLVYHLQ
jgi:hypothetical protein